MIAVVTLLRGVLKIAKRVNPKCSDHKEKNFRFRSFITYFF